MHCPNDDDDALCRKIHAYVLPPAPGKLLCELKGGDGGADGVVVCKGAQQTEAAAVVVATSGTTDKLRRFFNRPTLLDDWLVGDFDVSLWL